MKHITLLLLTLFTCTFSYSQEDFQFSRKNVVKLSPFELGKAEFHASYERYFGNRTSSLMITPGVILEEDLDQERKGYQIMGQYRFYLSHLSKENGDGSLGLYNLGFYAGGYGLFLDYTEDYLFQWFDQVNNESKSQLLNKTIRSGEGGAVIGIHIDITERIIADFFIGGGIRVSEVNDEQDDLDLENIYYEDYDVFDLEYQGVKPRIGFQLGITF